MNFFFFFFYSRNQFGETFQINQSMQEEYNNRVFKTSIDSDLNWLSS